MNYVITKAIHPSSVIKLLQKRIHSPLVRATGIQWILLDQGTQGVIPFRR